MLKHHFVAKSVVSVWRIRCRREIVCSAMSSSCQNDISSEKRNGHTPIHVDIIIPVHNASSTVEAAVRSAMRQTIPHHLHSNLEKYCVTVCGYDDGSTDDSWSILQRLQEEFLEAGAGQEQEQERGAEMSSSLQIQKSLDGVARGAGFARNRAIESHPSVEEEAGGHHFLCLLDSDDMMHPHRVAEQTRHMLQLTVDDRRRMLLGCNFDRDPPDSTWHYSRWANSLDDARLMLERFREVTVLQPTWFLCRSRWEDLGGYVEAPPPGSDRSATEELVKKEQKSFNKLVHPVHDNLESLRLAEDLRFFHDHLHSDGLVRLHRTETPLVTYRHTGTSQSFRTSRKLLLQLRVLAFERSILWNSTSWQKDEGRFVVWGAGRDGKDLFKAMSADLRQRVYCFVDVDEKKLAIGNYVNRDLGTNVPIVHFSFLVRDKAFRLTMQRQWESGAIDDEILGRIDKSKEGDLGDKANAVPSSKKRKTNARTLHSRGLDMSMLQRLPVVVCVAMYRTNGALERNVKSIGRKEGTELWHFS